MLSAPHATRPMPMATTVQKLFIVLFILSISLDFLSRARFGELPPALGKGSGEAEAVAVELNPRVGVQQPVGRSAVGRLADPATTA